VLIARRKDKLKEIAKEIKNEKNVKVITLSLDLLSKNSLAEIEKITNDIEIGLLVNNAGIMCLGNYTDFSLEDYTRMIDLNVKIPTILKHHFVEKMISRKKGGIINLAGMVGLMGDTLYIYIRRYKSLRISCIRRACI
jgi:short-subunit dehydrogenase